MPDHRFKQSETQDIAYTPNGYYVGLNEMQLSCRCIARRDTMKLTPVGHALSLLIAISFVICVGWGGW